MISIADAPSERLLKRLQQIDRIPNVHTGMSCGVDRHLGQAVLAAGNEHFNMPRRHARQMAQQAIPIAVIAQSVIVPPINQS